MQQILAAILILFLLAGCVAPAPTAPALTGDSIRIEQIWARPSPLPNGNSAIYFNLVNPTDAADRLVAVSSPAGMASLHKSVTESGVVRMEAQSEGLVIEPSSSVILAPGGTHVMLMGIAEPLAVGDQISVTLSFEQMGEIILTVPVQEER